MRSLPLLLMLIAGAGIAAQIAVNAQLASATRSAVWAANIVFAVSLATGVVAIAGSLVFSRFTWPDPALWRAPAWVWTGGLFGAVYVMVAILLADRLGAALVSAVGILGQLGASILIDHYGWFGLGVQRATPTRLIGVALLAAGVVLIRWK
jgi:transporter family-2 protein